MSYEIRFTRQAAKDAQKLSPKLQDKLKTLLRGEIAQNPHRGKPLMGDLKGYYAVRLNRKDRLVYAIDEAANVVVILRAKSHYGD